jgi:hypothetical protein
MVKLFSTFFLIWNIVIIKKIKIKNKGRYLLGIPNNVVVFLASGN